MYSFVTHSTQCPKNKTKYSLNHLIQTHMYIVRTNKINNFVENQYNNEELFEEENIVF